MVFVLREIPLSPRKRAFILASAVALSLFLCASPDAAAQSVLRDANGDGTIEILAFGDSITYGVGDGTMPGQYVPDITDRGPPRGYPLRLSGMLGLPVVNAGVPGEEVVGIGVLEPGVDRFPEVVVGSAADVVIIKEGVNDAVHIQPAAAISEAIQKMINVGRAEGKSVVIATLAPPTGNHASLRPFTESYSASIRELAILNSVPLVDTEALFVANCPILEACAYYNLPEGLHPNTIGYDAITEAVAAALAG